MAKIQRSKKNNSISKDNDYSAMLSGIVSLLTDARKNTIRSINSIMTSTYWFIGQHIVEFQQSGEERAKYGKGLLKKLSEDLNAKYGRGFGQRNIYQMRQFFLTYKNILQDFYVEPQLDKPSDPILQKPSAKLDLVIFAKHFRLPWSHYVRLLSVKNPNARRFYEIEALRGGWSEPQLNRQISSMFYERTALSNNKVAMLEKGSNPNDNENLTAEEEIKHPLVLEFLGLKDEYSELDMEEAIIKHLEIFLLELGGDFTFVGRQRRLRIDDSWYRVDLIFFHRKLKCLVLIDIKLGKFSHADSGQMHLYLNYARENWSNKDENPPVGIILCAEKGHELAKYALSGLPNKILATEYQTILPNERDLVAEIEKTRALLENRMEK
jgi:predicted nuclease of restriction endonuclease-like (RecB) superfamily